MLGASSCSPLISLWVSLSVGGGVVSVYLLSSVFSSISVCSLSGVGVIGFFTSSINISFLGVLPCGRSVDVRSDGIGCG